MLIIVALVFSSAALYANPKETNVKIFYDAQGNLYTGIHVTYFENGNKSGSLQIVNGLIQGKATYFYENGKTKEIGQFIDGKKEGEWIKYDEKGNIIGKAFFKNDLKHGKWEIFSSNGTRIFEMYYDGGKRTGTWKQWDEKGSLIETRNF